MKEEKTNINKKNIIVFSIIAAIIVVIILAISWPRSNDSELPEEITLPNFINMTYSQAKEEANKVGLNLTIDKLSTSEKDDAIVTQQYRESMAATRKGDTIRIILKSKEELEKIEEGKKQSLEKEKLINKACNEYADLMQAKYNGGVKYLYTNFYAKTDTSGDVYKIKYTTSDKNKYYYQLVSFNKDYTQVIKSSDLFEFYDYGNGEETSFNQELEYEYNTIFK